MDTRLKKIAVSCDEYGHLVEVLLTLLRNRGYEPIYYGPHAGEESRDWPIVTKSAIDEVLQGNAEEAIVMCWTGTGCSIVANKMPGIRAALCLDAATARGAKEWNHANVLALSMRITSEVVLKEILDAWFDTPFSADAWNVAQVDFVNELDDHRASESSKSE
ncbi:MAG: RpiB/LacA/LacB family sugar-phosphate isomerase [Rhodothermaceae bacterium]|nr:RpiB/LacA/LacB family sugar-phosphate isomerase [Bacteroidota bacterium]MXW13750.1 RpiB/LacA/LacB family sugar-phosphate isomerase [Rhodothermaceae bacterium]MDE2645686.1 RpiB/LacA/LacB family sugar-phosphate isomerase [Bacteroidota bacterium]MXW31680.1 RpiB/LacA/LacB family sugar-phosphate isomerase [Rhodothermaceae bacterium]MXX97020.1 RpiB/LacA/LacB family sugar-phosphate isomerase [Rhodothermaceae bacterium]